MKTNNARAQCMISHLAINKEIVVLQREMKYKISYYMYVLRKIWPQCLIWVATQHSIFVSWIN